MHQIGFWVGLRRPNPTAEHTYSTPQTSWLDLTGPTSKGKESRSLGGEIREEKGREKGEGEREGGAWRRERKDGRGREGINLPHGRLKTLAALCNQSTNQQTHVITIPPGGVEVSSSAVLNGCVFCVFVETAEARLGSVLACL